MPKKKKLPRIEYKKILYVTDLSEAGRSAFPHAASIAHHYDAELTVFHVVESRQFEKHLVGYINEDLWNKIRKRDLQEARDILVERKRDDASIKDSVDQFCQETLSGHKGSSPYVSYDVVVEIGDAVEKILAQVDKGGYDLVLISKHSHRKANEAFVGDTASRVTRRCNVPVMVVPLQKSEKR